MSVLLDSPDKWNTGVFSLFLLSFLFCSGHSFDERKRKQNNKLAKCILLLSECKCGFVNDEELMAI